MRADVYLTENGYAQSRQRARMMIEAGNDGEEYDTVATQDDFDKF